MPIFYNFFIKSKRILTILFITVLLFPIFVQTSNGSHCFRSTIYDTTYSPPRLVSFNALADTDCDQIPNSWETGGLNIKPDANGHIEIISGVLTADNKKEIDFVALGANPNHKDVFLEIDLMQDHTLWSSAINNVINAFARAPISYHNSPGLGITLHYDASLTDNTITHTVCTDMSTWTTFYNIKRDNIGKLSERNDVSNKDMYKAARINTFHYGLFIHDQCNAPGSSGTAEMPGNDFVISLGASGWGNPNGGHIEGSSKQQESTIMHEIGHNFDLKHGGGGSTGHINCKPQYLSVMNYPYQFEFPDGYRNWPVPIGTTSSIDYSRSYMNSLTENNLNELNALVVSVPSGLRAVYGPHLPSATYTNPLTSSWNSVDWNKNGVPSESSVTANINYFEKDYKEKCNSAIDTSPYFGYIDWNGLMYWGTSGNFSTGAPLVQNNLAPNIQNVIIDNNISNKISNQVTKQVDLSAVNDSSIIYQIENKTKIDHMSPCDPKDTSCVSPPPCDPYDYKCYPPPFTFGWQEYSIDDVKNVRNSHLMQIYENINSLQNNTSINKTSTNFEVIKDILHNISGSTNSIEILLYSNKIDEAINRLNIIANSLYEIQIGDDPNLKPDISTIIVQITTFIKGLEENK